MLNPIITIERIVWNKFWFNNPCVEAMHTDDNALSYIQQLLQIPSNIHGVLLKDNVLTKLLGYPVVYVEIDRFRQLKRELNQMNVSIIKRNFEDRSVDNILKVHIGDEVFLIARVIDVLDSRDSMHTQSSFQQSSLNCRVTKNQYASFDSEEFGVLDKIYRRESQGRRFIYEEVKEVKNLNGETGDVVLYF